VQLNTVDAESVDRLSELLRTFTAEQLDFIAERLMVKTDKDAAANAGLEYNTVCHWSNKQEINEAVKLSKLDTVLVAMEKMRRLTPKAVNVFDDEMNEGKKRRLDAAKEVLDRAGLPTSQRLEHTGAGGGSIVLQFGGNVDPDDV
jgi:hypothetical protein